MILQSLPILQETACSYSKQLNFLTLERMKDNVSEKRKEELSQRIDLLEELLEGCNNEIKEIQREQAA